MEFRRTVHVCRALALSVSDSLSVEPSVKLSRLPRAGVKLPDHQQKKKKALTHFSGVRKEVPIANTRADNENGTGTYTTE